MHHFLVKMGPDNFLTYFTMFWELTITFIYKTNLLQLKNTHISNILVLTHIFCGLTHTLTS